MSKQNTLKLLKTTKLKFELLEENKPHIWIAKYGFEYFSILLEIFSKRNPPILTKEDMATFIDFGTLHNLMMILNYLGEKDKDRIALIAFLREWRGQDFIDNLKLSLQKGFEADRNLSLMDTLEKADDEKSEFVDINYVPFVYLQNLYISVIFDENSGLL